MNNIAIIFSGQGSQIENMGAAFNGDENYQSTLQQIGNVRSDINYLLTQASQVELDDTNNAQIALFANQIAILEALKAKFAINDTVYAGFSLGEYSAICASGACSITDMACVIDKRAREMAKLNGCGHMQAVIGHDYEILSNLIDQLNIKYRTDVRIANYNQKNQMVIAATSEDLKQINDELVASKAKVIDLKVSGAFHTMMYKQAAEQFAEQISELEFRKVDNLYSNLHADLIDNVSSEYLKQHMINGVNWYPQIEKMLADGVDTFVEINAKSTLLPMIKRINRQAKLIHIASLEDINKLEDLWTRK